MYATEDPSRFFEYPRQGDEPDEDSALAEYDRRIEEQEFNERYENEMGSNR